MIHQIEIGSVIRIAVNSTEGTYRVIGLREGKAILGRGKSRWGLPESQVRAHGTVVKPPQPARNMKAWEVRRRLYLEETGREEGM